MINPMTGKAVNRVSGLAIGNSTLNLGVSAIVTNNTGQATVTMFYRHIGCVAVSTILSRKKGLIMCIRMINLTMAINAVHGLPHLASSYSFLYVQQLVIVAC